MAVLVNIAEYAGLVFENRYQPHLGVLLSDQILAFGAGHFPGHEDLQAGAQRVVFERIFRAEQFGR